MGLALESLGLVERAREFAALEASLAEAATGRGGVALVYGEAGIDKTSLVRSFCDDSSLPGEVLWGAATPCSRRVRYSAAFATLTGDDEEALRHALDEFRVLGAAPAAERAAAACHAGGRRRGYVRMTPGPPAGRRPRLPALSAAV
jgi:hypothetical protein